MSDKKQYGRTTTQSVDSMLVWKPDPAFGQTVCDNPGQTDTTSAEQLPTWDASPPVWRPVPRLRVSVTFRDSASPADIASDVFRLYQAADQMDLANGGSGLRVGGSTGEGRAIQVTFSPATLEGAEDRLGKIAVLLNEPGRFPDRSFELCVASVEAEA